MFWGQLVPLLCAIDELNKSICVHLFIRTGQSPYVNVYVLWTVRLVASFESFERTTQSRIPGRNGVGVVPVRLTPFAHPTLDRNIFPIFVSKVSLAGWGSTCLASFFLLFSILLKNSVQYAARWHYSRILLCEFSLFLTMYFIQK